MVWSRGNALGIFASAAERRMIMGHWITDGKIKIGWDMFPDRKKPAICITECDTNVIDVYGYFKDEKNCSSVYGQTCRIGKRKACGIKSYKKI